MFKFIYITCLLGILIDNVVAQYAIGPTIRIPSQATTQISKQQLLNYILTNSNQPLGNRLQVLATAVQQLPPKKNRRVYLADALKQSAFQNLLVAASVCGDVTNSQAIVPEVTATYATPKNYAGSPRQPIVNALNQPSVYTNAMNLSPLIANALNQAPLIANGLNQAPLIANGLNQAPLIANCLNQAPLIANGLNQAPLIANGLNQAPLIANGLNQLSMAINAPNQAPPVANPLNQLPLVANPLNQSPLVANPLNQSPQIPNWDFLSSILLKELLTSLVAQEYAPNRVARINYV